MCQLLVDALVWSCVTKARVLDAFLRSLRQMSVTLTLVIRQVEKTIDSWPELSAVLAAAQDGFIETVEPTDEERELLSLLFSEHPSLGAVDCGLLAVAKTRRWSLTSCHGRLAKAADTWV